LFSSCENNVDIKPIDELPIEELQSTEKNVNYILNGALRKVHNFPSFIRASVLYSDDFDLTNQTGTDVQQFRYMSFGVSNSTGDNLWNNCYEGIGYSNIVIDAIDRNLFTATAENKNKLKGEALFIRAIMHFTCVNHFSLPITYNSGNNPGIPIRTRYLNVSENSVPTPRNTIKEVYDQVIKDLKDAEALLPDEVTYRANKSAARAFLSRVYFSMNDYQNAYNYSDQIIKSGFTFGTSTSAYLTPFRTSGTTFSLNDGIIYKSINTSADDASGDLSGNFYNQADPKTTNFHLDSTSVVKSFAEINSSAFKNLIGFVLSGKFYYTGKYVGAANNTPIIRLAEMYYNRLESGIQLGTFSESDLVSNLNILNKVNGADSLVSTGRTKDDMIALTRSLRRFEFIGEADRFFELRRLQGTVRGVSLTSKNSLLKIPLGEVNANKDIEQN